MVNEQDRKGMGGWDYRNQSQGDTNLRGGMTNTFTRQLEEKSFRRVEKFTGGDAEWQEFRFDIMITTRTTNPELATQMENSTKAKKVDNDHY